MHNTWIAYQTGQLGNVLQQNHMQDTHINVSVRVSLAWLEPVVGHSLREAENDVTKFITVLNSVQNLPMDVATAWRVYDALNTIVIRVSDLKGKYLA